MRAPKIQVVGGGFAGLSLAYFLVKLGCSVRLVEKSGRHGGLLRTHQTPYGMVEAAANALLGNNLVSEVAADLGVELVGALPSAKKRFIFRHGKMRRWPLGLSSTLGLVRFFFRRRGLAPRSGENVRDWGMRALGAEATDYLLVPGLSGVYAGRAEELSASLILGRFFTKGKRARFRGSMAPLGGMEDWVKGFVEFLRGQGVEFSAQADEALPTVVALPPHRALEFLGHRSPTLTNWLRDVEMLPIVSVTAFFDGPGIPGFGCLFPRSEGFRVLGILANSQIFPDRGAGSETWIFGGATDPSVLGLTDQSLLELISAERSRLGFSGDLRHAEISRWPKAIPHYNLTLEKLLAEPRREGQYTLFGTYLGDLGLARILGRAKELAEDLAKE